MPVIASETGEAAPGQSAPRTVLLWASLVPLLLLLRPYAGLVQDARIYIGRGLADRDPAGLGRDMMFAQETQTTFSLFRRIVDALLSVADPGSLSLGLVALGLLLWLAAAALLLRRLAAGRTAWAAVVAVLALPGDYGPLHIFGYAEAIATPRLFAEAAVLLGLERIVARRPLPALAFLALALAVHPLMALPGLALAAGLLIRDDPRWFVPLAVLAAAGLAAAWLDAPVLGRVFVAMDPDWLAVVRARNANLFPTLWPADAFGTIGCHAAAAVIAGGFGADPGTSGRSVGSRRALLWGAAAVGTGGLLLSLLLGDLLPSLLVMQLQTWRALWLLSVLGNAGLALAAVDLWRGGAASRLALALLILAWSSQASPGLALPLAGAAVLCRRLESTEVLRTLSPRTGRLAVAAALAVAAVDGIMAAQALVALLLAPGADWRAVAPWPFVVASGVLTVPILAGAVALALAARAVPPRPVWRAAALASVVVLCGAAFLVWDSRNAERRLEDGRGGAAALAAGLGPGEGGLLWVDEDAETWFLARRPAFFSAVQGAPTLFSRPLALEWSERGRRLLAWGLVRSGDLLVSTRGERPADVALRPESIDRFCRDPAHPAGLVAPGDQRAAVPDGLPTRLWMPPSPIRRLSPGRDGPTWRSLDRFTVVSCAPPEP